MKQGMMQREERSFFLREAVGEVGSGSTIRRSITGLFLALMTFSDGFNIQCSICPLTFRGGGGGGGFGVF